MTDLASVLVFAILVWLLFRLINSSVIILISHRRGMQAARFGLRTGRWQDVLGPRTPVH
jgi:hypothetical protein